MGTCPRWYYISDAPGRVLSKSVLGIQHFPTLWSSPLSLPSFPLPSLQKSLVWHRQFRENRNANRRPQSNIQTLHHLSRSASRSLRRRQRVSPQADENHHKDELVSVVAMMMTMVRLVQGHRGSVCGTLYFERDRELGSGRAH